MDSLPSLNELALAPGLRFKVRPSRQCSQHSVTDKNGPPSPRLGKPCPVVRFLETHLAGCLAVRHPGSCTMGPKRDCAASRRHEHPMHRVCGVRRPTGVEGNAIVHVACNPDRSMHEMQVSIVFVPGPVQSAVQSTRGVKRPLVREPRAMVQFSGRQAWLSGSEGAAGPVSVVDAWGF